MKINRDFTLDKYGVNVRCVDVNDAMFITELRSDAQLGRFIHASNGDVSQQVDWIKKYKDRERVGEEFYFIFSSDNIDFGVCRLYNIDYIHKTYTGGSWICKKGTPSNLSMLTHVITTEIATEILGLLINIYEVRKENKIVLRFHRDIMKSWQYGETELDYLFMATPETRQKSILKKILGIYI